MSKTTTKTYNLQSRLWSDNKQTITKSSSINNKTSKTNKKIKKDHSKFQSFFNNLKSTKNINNNNWHMDGWFLSNGELISGPFSINVVINADEVSNHRYDQFSCYRFISRTGFSKWYDRTVIKNLFKSSIPKDLMWQWSNEEKLKLALNSYNFQKLNSHASKANNTDKQITNNYNDNQKSANDHSITIKSSKTTNYNSLSSFSKANNFSSDFCTSNIKNSNKNSKTSHISSISLLPSSNINSNLNSHSNISNLKNSNNIKSAANLSKMSLNDLKNSFIDENQLYITLKGKLRLGQIDNCLASFVFNIFTLGINIYSTLKKMKSEIYWYSDLYESNTSNKILKIFKLISTPFYIFLCMMPIISAPMYYSCARRINKLQISADYKDRCSLVIVLMLSLLPPLALAYLQYHLGNYWKFRLKKFLFLNRVNKNFKTV